MVITFSLDVISYFWWFISFFISTFSLFSFIFCSSCYL